MLVIRDLTAEHCFARRVISHGRTRAWRSKTASSLLAKQQVAQLIAENGLAAKPGDRVVITNVIDQGQGNRFRDQRRSEEEREVVSARSGRRRWDHDHAVGAAPKSLEAKGSMVTLEFDKYVPEITGDQVRDMLAPVFDFKALNQAEAYEKTLPPKVQEAIKNHKVLVGMDRDMVIYAKGRPPRKIRDKDDKGQDYEEWIYGNPPEEVDFVRFQGEVVARLEIMTVDGEKIVRTEKEVDLQVSGNRSGREEAGAKPANAPTLRRPGEQPENPQTPIAAPARPYPARGTTVPDNPTPAPDGTPAPDELSRMGCRRTHLALPAAAPLH